MEDFVDFVVDGLDDATGPVGCAIVVVIAVIVGLILFAL